MSSWIWPEANDAPTSGGYVARHPTRYTWRVDVEEWARWLVDHYQGRVWCNTYYDHPEGYGRDLDSIDVWAYGGRGYAIENNVGNAVFKTLFEYRGEPQIDWIIWQATIYGAWNGWAGEPFGSDDFTWHYDHIHVTYKPNAGGGGGGGSPNHPLGEYPGNCADPEPFAHWMGYVAETEFGLPPALPIMTVAVELTSALTSKGCLDDIPGFLAAQDHDSVGIFQQRPSQGWGTYEQCVDPEYALRKFCEEAEKLKDYEWHRDTTDPDALGRWCQAVQRSGVPNAYRDKGYPIAASLLKSYNPSPGPGPGPGPAPGPSPGPDDDIGIHVDKEVKEQIRKWGLYYFASDSEQNWNLTYQPASGKSSPVDPGPTEPELHKARSKPQEVSYYIDEDEKYVVVQPNGTEIRYSHDEFKAKYEEVE